MPRKLSEQHDNIAWFYEGILAHLDMDNNLFLGGAVLSIRERHQVQSKLKHLAEEHRNKAAVYRDEDR